jgi:hypothetical protein
MNVSPRDHRCLKTSAYNKSVVSLAAGQRRAGEFPVIAKRFDAKSGRGVQTARGVASLDFLLRSR